LRHDKVAVKFFQAILREFGDYERFSQASAQRLAQAALCGDLRAQV
jgi:hypothetical protein